MQILSDIFCCRRRNEPDSEEEDMQPQNHPGLTQLGDRNYELGINGDNNINRIAFPKGMKVINTLNIVDSDCCYLYGNPAERVHAPNVDRIVLDKCPNITEVIAEAATYIGLEDCPKIRNVTGGNLEIFQFINCPNLRHVTANNATKFSDTRPSDIPTVRRAKNLAMER